MRLYIRRTVIDFIHRYPDAEQSLLAWLSEIEAAHYENPAQLRQRHGSADFVGDRVVFDIGGNKYRLVVRVIYADLQVDPPLKGIVFILFLGTHKQYDRIDVAKLKRPRS
jgi:mRNA interferase HigB